METNAFQISVIASKVRVSVAPYSVTCCIAIGNESCKYVLNTILRKIPLLFLGFKLDLGLKYTCDFALSFFVPLRILPLS